MLNVLSKWASVIDPKGANSIMPAWQARFINQTGVLFASFTIYAPALAGRPCCLSDTCGICLRITIQ